MYGLESKVRPTSAEYRENYAHNTAKAKEFRERLTTLKGGGPPKAVEKHKKRGKLTARERLERLLTPIRRSSS